MSSDRIVADLTDLRVHAAVYTEVARAYGYRMEDEPDDPADLCAGQGCGHHREIHDGRGCDDCGCAAFREPGR